MTIHKPNVHGDLPEILVNDACDTAGIEPPNLPTHWCD